MGRELSRAIAPGSFAGPPMALRDQIDEMATLLTAEMGKPLSESRAEVAFAADYLEWFAEEAVRIAGRSSVSPDGESQHLVVRTPSGLA